MGTEWADADEAKKCDLLKGACQEAYADGFISKLPKGYEIVDNGNVLT